jgi:hypothetical protein
MILFISVGGLPSYEQCCQEAAQENPEAQVQKTDEKDAT